MPTGCPETARRSGRSSWARPPAGPATRRSRSLGRDRPPGAPRRPTAVAVPRDLRPGPPWPDHTALSRGQQDLDCRPRVAQGVGHLQVVERDGGRRRGWGRRGGRGRCGDRGRRGGRRRRGGAPARWSGGRSGRASRVLVDPVWPRPSWSGPRTWAVRRSAAASTRTVRPCDGPLPRQHQASHGRLGESRLHADDAVGPDRRHVVGQHPDDRQGDGPWATTSAKVGIAMAAPASQSSRTAVPAVPGRSHWRPRSGCACIPSDAAAAFILVTKAGTLPASHGPGRRRGCWRSGRASALSSCRSVSFSPGCTGTGRCAAPSRQPRPDRPRSG